MLKAAKKPVGRWGVRAGVFLLVLAGLLAAHYLVVSPLCGPDGRVGQVILRMSLAAVFSFVVVVLASPRLIRFLVRKKCGDRPEFDHLALNELTRHKSDTPTMGGILIVAAIVASMLVFGDLKNMYVRMSLFTLICLGALGAIDDWFKLRRKITEAAGKPSRDGLKSWQKILFQIGLAVLLAYGIYHHGCYEVAGTVRGPFTAFHLPFGISPIQLSYLVFVLISILVMVGSSNAVNLTDGMDGLAGGCMITVSGVFLVLSWVSGVQQWASFFEVPYVPQAAELTVFCASIIGACLGFLWYNSLPAQYFMGDTGSLALGGAIGYVSVVTRQELMLLVAGGVFVMEALSVVIQVTYFKATGGKRVFRCSPIHHHFHLGGWAESKVVARFWLLSIVFAALAMAMLKLR